MKPTGAVLLGRKVTPAFEAATNIEVRRDHHHPCTSRVYGATAPVVPYHLPQYIPPTLVCAISSLIIDHALLQKALNVWLGHSVLKVPRFAGMAVGGPESGLIRALYLLACNWPFRPARVPWQWPYRRSLDFTGPGQLALIG